MSKLGSVRLSGGNTDISFAAAGYKTTRKYRTVVVEEHHESGVTWVVDREYYESDGSRRYSKNSTNARVPGDTSLDAIYEAAETAVTYDVLREHGVEGDLQVAIRYYRDNGLYECAFEEQEYGAEAVVKRESTEAPMSEFRTARSRPRENQERLSILALLKPSSVDRNRVMDTEGEFSADSFFQDLCQPACKQEYGFVF